MFEINFMVEDIITKYFNNAGKLNDIIANTAIDNDLNDDMIKRIIEAVNVTVFNVYLEKVNDKTFTFPVADFALIKNIIAQKVLDATHTETLRNFQLTPETQLDNSAISDIDEDNDQDNDQDNDNPPKIIRDIDNGPFNPKIFQDLATQRQDLQDNISDIHANIDVTNNGIADLITKYIKDSQFRTLMNYIFRALADNEIPIFNNALSKVSEDLTVFDKDYQDYIKNRTMHIDELDNENIAVINSDNPINIGIKQIKKQVRQLEDANQKLAKLDKTADYYTMRTGKHYLLHGSS